MRRAFWALMACAAASTTGAPPAAAQTYDPAYPVCLYVYTRGDNYYECRYTSTLGYFRICFVKMRTTEPLIAPAASKRSDASFSIVSRCAKN